MVTKPRKSSHVRLLSLSSQFSYYIVFHVPQSIRIDPTP